MERKGLATQKVSRKTGLIILMVLAIPAFFWFHFLYNMFFADSMTPEMQKMRAAMLQPHPKRASAPVSTRPGTKNSATGSGEKGETK